jgi:hypothetical protein
VFYPDPASTDGDKGTEIDAAHSKVGWKLKNWACGKLTSKGEHWKYAQKHTCDFVKNVEGRAVDSMIWKGIRSYCHHENQGFECDATIAFVLKFSNAYAGFESDFASPYCLLFFDDMFQHCHEKGGTAEMIHHNHKGHFSALFHRADSGDTCPADTTKTKCKREPFYCHTYNVPPIPCEHTNQFLTFLNWNRVVTKIVVAANERRNQVAVSRKFREMWEVDGSQR